MLRRSLSLLAGFLVGTAPARASDWDAVVVGAGMGGLSAAAHLSVAGRRVLVLEQHAKVGGCTTSFQRGDYTFETSLHEMAGGGAGGPLADALREVGVADGVELIRIDPLYRVVAPGVDFTMPARTDDAREALIARWPEEREGIDRFFRVMRRVTDDVSEIGNLDRLSPRVALVPFRQPTLLRWIRAPLASLLDRFFEDPSLKVVLGQFWIYLGPPPSRLSSVVHLACLQTYLDHGAWHVRGTSQALSDAYAARVRALGGEVRTGARVESILVEGGRVVGVRVAGGEVHRAPVVVSAVDPFQTFDRLLPPEVVPDRWRARRDALRPGPSLAGVWLGLDVEPSHWGIRDHEIFVDAGLDPEATWSAMIEGRWSEGAAALTFGTNLGDSTYAPPGRGVLSIVTYADIDRFPEDRELYAAEKARMTEALLDLAERVAPGLRNHIVVRESFTPRTIRTWTSAHRGIPYGFEYSRDQLRRLPHATPVEGLYLASSWTNPGHGVSTSQLAGRDAARRILEDHPWPRP